MADLTQLQRQFYDRVVGRVVDRAADAAVGRAAEDPHAGGLIASGDVDVYARMYRSRLHDALAEDYPKLHVALGDERFGELVAGYFRAHPPSSFTLREAGVALAGYLAHQGDQADHEPWPAWAADLAALERARVEVFDGPDASPLVQDAVAALGAELPELALS